MELISGRVEENDEDRNGGFAPTPGAGILAHGFADGAPEQGGKHGVFSEVRAFPNRVVNCFDVWLAHVGEQPVQQRFDEARGVRVGFGIA